MPQVCAVRNAHCASMAQDARSGLFSVVRTRNNSHVLPKRIPLSPSHTVVLAECLERLLQRPEFRNEAGRPNQSALARALSDEEESFSPSSINRVLNGKSTGTMRMLDRVAKMFGKSNGEELVSQGVRLCDLEGYEPEIIKARAASDHPEWVWDRVPQILAMKGQVRVTAHDLISLANYVASTMAKQPGSTPPGGRPKKPR